MLRLALRILTCNVNGIRDNTKRKNIFQYLQKSNSNIILLQETHSSPSTNNIWSKEWDGKIIWNSGTNFKCGVAILIKNNTNIKILQTNQDTLHVFSYFIGLPNRNSLINIEIHMRAPKAAKKIW